MRRTTRRVRRGFTILELLIVIGILLALGGIVLYNLTGQSEKANEGIVRTQMNSMKRAIQLFRADVKRLPTEEEGIAALWDKSRLDEEVAARWGGPYLEEPIPKDLWGYDWIYVCPAEGAAIGFDIVSIGPDGQENTEDDLHLAKVSEGDGDFSDFSGSGGSGGSGTTGGSGGGG